MQIITDENTKIENHLVLPVLAVRGLVFFPGMMLQFDVARKKSILAVSEALSKDRLIFLVTQIDLSEKEPRGEDLYKTGVIARIAQVVHHSEEGVKLHVEGICRGEINSLLREEPYLLGDVTKCPMLTYKPSYRSEALLRIVHEKFDEYLRLFKHVPPDVLLGVLQEKDCGRLADYIASNISIDYERKQYILDELRPLKRMQKLIDILAEEVKILAVENEINQKAQAQMDENQREYFLKEQMRAIASELGDVMKESAGAAITCIRTRAGALGISPKFYEKCDIHIHAPEGAVPKDGPSAGIAMATAITSALCGIPVRHDVAMTGEITLQGRVLPIGGLKEKSMAAYKNGIKTVLIPAENVPDLAEVDSVVKENVKFIPVKRVDTVLETALTHMPRPVTQETVVLAGDITAKHQKAPELYQ